MDFAIADENRRLEREYYDRLKAAEELKAASTPKPGFLESASAILQQSNTLSATVGAISLNEGVPVYAKVEGHNPFQGDNLKGYEMFANEFVHSNSPEEDNYIKNKIDRNVANSQVVAATGGWGTFGGIAGGVVDPINMALMFVPGGMMSVPGRVGQSALRSMLSGAAASVTNEVILHQFQPLRTGEETAFNLMAGAVLDGILGAGYGALTKTEKDWLTKEIEEALINGNPPGGVGGQGGMSVGAMGAQYSSGAPLKSGWGFGRIVGFEWALKKMMEGTAAGRALLSKNANVRGVAQRMAEVAPEVEGDSLPVSVFTRTKHDQARYYNTMLEVDALRKSSNMPIEEFSTAVSMAIREGGHEVASVAAAAKKLQSELFDPYIERMAQLKFPGTYREIVQPDGTIKIEPIETSKLLPTMLRMFDLNQVRANPLGFKEGWKQGVIQQHAKELREAESVLAIAEADLTTATKQLEPIEAQAKAAQERIKKAREDFNVAEREISLLQAEGKTVSKKKLTTLEKLRATRDKSLEDYTPLSKTLQEAKDKVHEVTRQTSQTRKLTPKPLPADDVEWATYLNDVYDQVINLRRGDVHSTVKGPSDIKWFHPKADISDHALRNFLVHDIGKVSRHFIDTASPRIHLADEFGDFELKAELDLLQDRLNVQTTALERTGTAKGVKDANDLRDAFRKEKKALEDLRDQLLHRNQESFSTDPETRGIATALRVARNYNVVRLLGKIVIANLPDLARVIIYKGIGDKWALAMAKGFQDINLTGLSKDQLVRVAVAHEKSTQTRLHLMNDIEDMPFPNKIEMTSRWMADQTMLWTGMTHFQIMNKMATAHMFQDEFVRSVLKGVNRAKAKHLGIDDAMYDAIKVQIDKHAVKDGGLYSANVGAWTDRLAIEAMERAAIKEVDTVVVTPGLGEKFTFLKHPLMAASFQFKSFIQAAMFRLTLPAMQDRSMNSYKLILAMTMMGGFSYYLRQKASGQKVETNPVLLMREAIDRSGLLGYGMEMFNMSQKAFGIDPFTDIPRLAGADVPKVQATRYQGRSAAESILGPTYGLVQPLGTVIHPSSTVDERTHAVRRMMPWQNHWALDRGLSAVEGSIAEKLGGTGIYGEIKQ